MTANKLNRTLVAVAIAQLFATAAFAADDVPATPPADNTPEAAAAAAAAAPMQIVQVAAQRSPRMAARKAQEDAPNLVNIVTADDIKKLPDVNAAEAIRRMPGVSMTIGSGEGRFINIRGLDSDLTTTTFGGVRLPPTNTATPMGGGRAVEMGTIPSGMIGSITVTKTNTPDQDAEALGGTVEITPKSIAPGADSFLDARIGAGVESLRNSPVRDLSLSGGTRFGFGPKPADGSVTSYSDKPFSFVGSMSYYNDKRGIDDLEGGYVNTGSKAYSSLDQRYYNMTRNRYGVGGELAYEPDANNKWYVRYYDSGYTETINRQILNYNFVGAQPQTQNPDGSFSAPTTTFLKSLRDEHETMSSQVFTIGGKNLIGDTTVDYHIAHTQGADNRTSDYSSTFKNPTVAAVTYNNTANPNVPQIISVTGMNPASPAGYAMTGFSNTPIYAQTKEWSGVVNVSLPTHLTSADHEQFKTGVSARFRTNDYITMPQTYSLASPVPLSSVITGSPITYYDGNYQNGYQISVPDLRNIYGQGVRTPASIAADLLNQEKGTTHNTENVMAAYAQEEMTFGKLGLLGGVRLETTKAQYDGNAASGASISPVQFNNSYHNFFPTLQARYELDKNSLVRASFSTTIARPGFQQTSATTNVNIAAAGSTSPAVTIGNPGLKPITSQNFDLAFEHYLPHGGIASVGIFDKALSNYIVSRVSTQTFSNSGIYAGLNGAPVLVASFSNVDSARARGAELNYEQRYTFLPGFLSGFGTSANATYVDSRIQIRPGEYSMLPSTSKNTYNASVFWERDGLNLRLSTSYMSTAIYGVGKTAGSDIFSAPRRSLDFGGSYQLTKHVGLFASVKNITNTPTIYYQGTPDRITQRELYGQTYEGGVNISF